MRQHRKYMAIMVANVVTAFMLTLALAPTTFAEGGGPNMCGECPDGTECPQTASCESGCSVDPAMCGSGDLGQCFCGGGGNSGSCEEENGCDGMVEH